MPPLVTIEMLGHPRGKGRPRTRRLGNGHVLIHTDEKTAEYEGNLRLVATRAMEGRVILEMPLRVLIEARFPIPASKSEKWKRAARAGDERPTVKPDCDNILKVCDALNTVVWLDDKQIVECACIKRYSDKPAIRISVWPAAAVAVTNLFDAAAA